MAARVIFFAAMLSLGVALAQSSGTTGTIRGSVTDLAGTPLAGATVRYMAIPASVAAGAPRPVPGEKVVNGSVVADANGKFTAAGLPAATALLCANVPGAPYLDPCIWGNAVRAAVAGGAIANQNLSLSKGVYLNVRINDPKGLLPAGVDGPWTKRKIQVGVAYGTGAYQGALNTSADSGGRNYQLIIPAGKSFVLWLYSSDFALANSSGATVTSPAGGTAFQAAPGQDQNFTFTVTRLLSHAQ